MFVWRCLDTALPSPLTEPVIHIPEHPARLHNKRCAYCGVDLATVRKTFDHVIGRNFAPKGQLHKQWNVMLGACHSCNLKKAELENDISAITMQPDASGRFAEDDPVLKEAAWRKGWGSKSAMTGKRVADSATSVSVKVPMFTGAMGFYPLIEARRSDWGNPVHTWFMQTVAPWPFRLLGPLASGYAWVAIRRHPAAECWSWALEWNKTFRMIDFMGSRSTTRSLLTGCPKLDGTRVQTGPKSWIGIRHDVPLADTNDAMFYMPETEVATVAVLQVPSRLATRSDRHRSQRAALEQPNRHLLRHR